MGNVISEEQAAYWEQQAAKWKGEGRTKAILFGRFQPLHLGHMALLEAIRRSGLEVHVVINEKHDTPDERNPYNFFQKIAMFGKALPWLSSRNLHPANVYLGGGGDVGKDVAKLSSIFEGIAPASEIVIFYGFKEEDRKTYLVNGKTHDGIHYVDLLTGRLGPFSQHIVRPPTIAGYLDIDAKLYRGDRARRNLLHPDVADYLDWQHSLATLNGRSVGEENPQDKTTLCFEDWRRSRSPVRERILRRLPGARIRPLAAQR